MNVKFRILWFEDTPAWLKNEKENVEELLQEHYLIPEIDCFDGEDIDEGKITDNKYDLILMDYMLAEEKTGDAIAQIIRSNKVLTDILFYSSNTDQMYEAIKRGIPELDGIYITKRDTKTFKSKVSGIIQKIIKRSEDIVNLRGFVLDNTSDFETRISSVLLSCYNFFGNNYRETLNQKMQKVINRSIDGKKSSLDEYIKDDNFFEQATENHTLTDISTKLSVLQAAILILKTDFSMPDELCSSKFTEYYMNTIGQYRNKLGHAKADDSQIFIFGQAEKIDSALHQKLRRNVTDVDKTIKRLEEYVANLVSD